MRRMTLIGIALIVLGILIGITVTGTSFSYMFSKDPSTSNEGIITSSGGTAELGKGTHQIWYEGDVTGPILVRGPGNITSTLETADDSENYESVYLWGDFDAEAEGQYRFEFTGSGNLYVTEDFSVGTYLTMITLGIVGGIILVMVGVVLTVIGIIRQKKLDQSSFFQEAPGQEQTPPPQ